MSDVQPSPADLDAAKHQLEKIEAEVAKTEAVLARKLPALADFRKAGGLVIWDIVRQLASGELGYRNADEATKVAERLIGVINGTALAELGEEISKVPAENQKAVLAELTAKAIERQGT